ncbi:hypothetical protein JYB64_25530, partial [Algoriphagus aestuarii]|nr:hypothetical protein [Algoriphagus aestuarii]
TDVGPLAWAIGDAGLVIQPHDRAAFVDALEQLRDSSVRTSYGDRARSRAMHAFSVEALAPLLSDFCTNVVDAHRKVKARDDTSVD